MRNIREQRRRLRPKPTIAVLVVLAVGAIAAVVAATAAGKSTKAEAGSPIKIGILSDCQGPFGNQYNADIGGAIAAFDQFAGAKPKNPSNPSAGMIGGSIDGHPLEIVGFGCSNSKPDAAIAQTRRLMEQLHADVMIGPLSGDEAVAVAHYAVAHPQWTFVNGTAGSQDPTLQIHPPNFFRFNGDGAQWNAGIGDLAYHKLGWRKAAIIMDDYSFGWTSAAGMIADFCAVGGDIVKRVFAPLGTTDYSSLVRQLPPPSKVDGYFWVVGGTGTVPSLKAFTQAYGPLTAKKVIGNLFFEVTGNFQQVAPQVSGAYVGGFGTPGTDYASAAAKAYVTKMKSIFKQVPPLGPMNVANAYNGFFFNYYKAAWGLVDALKAVKGNITPSQKPLQAALGKVVLNTPFGVVKLDKDHQAIEGEWSYQIIAKPGQTDVKTVQYIPNVNQTFGGLFSRASPPPSRTQPACKKASLPWVGKEKPVVNGVIK
jgi:branched-chain amino acid transport system substrate-binding protein